MKKRTDEFFLKGNNITKFENNSKAFNLNSSISNLFFNIKSGESVGFIFDNQDEKKSFINILSGHENRFNGYLQFGEKFYYSKNCKEIRDIVHSRNINDLYIYKNKNIKSLDFLWNRNNYKNHINSIKKNIDSFNNYNHLNRFRLLFNAKQNELLFYKKINTEIFKNIEIINSFRNLLSQDESKQNISFLIQTVNSFYAKYYEYLKTRIELVYHQNLKLIDLILDDFTNKKNVERDNLSRNIEKLKSELNKKRSQQNVNLVPKNKKNEKNVVLSLLKIQKYEYLNYKKKCKQALKHANNTKSKINYLTRFYVNDFCYKWLKKNIWSLSDLSLPKVNEFLIEFKKHYSLLIFDFGLILKNEEKRINKNKAFKKIESIFSFDISSYVNISAHNDSNANQIKKSFDSTDTNDVQPITWNNNVILKKNEFQTLVDELEWEFSNNVIAVNEQFASLTDEAKKHVESYNTLKKEFDFALSAFINERNECFNKIKNDKTNSAYINQWKNIQGRYKLINHECLKVYSQIKNDFIQINDFLKGKISTHKKRHFNSLIYKYEIYKSAYSCGLNILDLETFVSSQPNISISKLILVEALLSNKSIFVFNDIFEKLSKNERESFEGIFNSLKNRKQKIIINVASRYAQIKNVISFVNFIHNSKNIEFGDKSVIEKNPLYSFTYEQINEIPAPPMYEKRKINNSFGLESFSADFSYDYYMFDQEHFVFANIEDVYKWTNSFPQSFVLTFDPFKIDFIKSKVLQSLNSHNNQENFKNDFIFDNKEKTIINLSNTHPYQQYETKN